MKQMIILLLTIILSSNSCDKGIIKDDNLTLEKISYTCNHLKINGYYYSQFGEIYRIYFFYTNGIILSGGDVYKTNLYEYEQNYKDGSFWASNKDNKLYWGLYNVDSSQIMIEKWYPSSGGGMPVYLHTGEIQNDTTFIITKSVRSKTGEEKELNEIYHFKELSPKPDSTNIFIL